MFGSLRLRFGLVPIILALLLALFFARWTPHESLPAVVGDSGVFLYIGQQINNGLTPYADLWDIKPPFIFWLNAFARRFTPASARGIVYLAYVSVLAFFIVALVVLRPRVGTCPTIFALPLAIDLLPDMVVGPSTAELLSFLRRWVFSERTGNDTAVSPCRNDD